MKMNAIQKAIEVLEDCYKHPNANDAIAGLRAMLVQPSHTAQREPIADDVITVPAKLLRRCLDTARAQRFDFLAHAIEQVLNDQQTPSHTARRGPLTSAEIEKLLALWDYDLHGDRARYLVREAEKVHGITKGDK
jgi:hypothetical protein